MEPMLSCRSDMYMGHMICYSFICAPRAQYPRLAVGQPFMWPAYSNPKQG
jgi:hypothetical protein